MISKTCIQEQPTTACIFDEIKWSNNYSMLKQFYTKEITQRSLNIGLLYYPETF
jgi:hypothetical protein